MTDTCLFCRIVRGEIPAKIVLEDEHVVAFRDIDPEGADARPRDPDGARRVARRGDGSRAWSAGCMLAAAEIARSEGITDGYRTVINTGAGAGQTVFHVHLHLLGGRKLTWPPG